MALDTDFKEAMARFASGVTVVMTVGPDGRPAGFTATSFCSLSLNPPLVLVCLAQSAECFPTFSEASSFSVNVLAADQRELAMRFATHGADKFAGLMQPAASSSGLPQVPGAVVQVECVMHDQYLAGDHVILIGRVIRAAYADSRELIHVRRRFGTFSEEPE